MSFGSKLRMLRVSQKMDQQTLSKKLNISQPVYSRYENDEKIIRVDDPVIKRLAEEFCVSVDWLLEENESVPKNGVSVNYFMQVLIKQQQTNEKILRLLSENKINL